MPLAVFALLITGADTGAAAIVIERFALPVPPVFVALIVMFDVPAVVGVPLIAPVAVSTVNPVGSPVAPNDVALLLAVIW